jgi:hypothetical protein
MPGWELNALLVLSDLKQSRALQRDGLLEMLDAQRLNSLIHHYLDLYTVYI